MTRHVMFGIALVALLAYGSPMALAAEHGGSTSVKPAKAKPAAAKPATQVMSAEGSISKVDLQASTVTLTDAMGKEWTFALEKTSVWRGGQLASLSDLKPGESAKVRYAAQGGKSVARSIEIKATAQAQ